MMPCSTTPQERRLFTLPLGGSASQGRGGFAINHGTREPCPAATASDPPQGRVMLTGKNGRVLALAASISRSVLSTASLRLSVLLLVLSIGFSGATGSQVQAGDLIAWGGRTMGTTYSVKIYADDPSAFDAEGLRLSVDAELRQVNDEMSTYLNSSEISRFNDSTSTDWIDISPSFAKVVTFAQSVAQKTDGAFDITVAPLVDAWNFGPGPRTDHIPTDETLAEIASRVGHRHLQVRLNPPSIKKSIAGLRIDLSAIAKGQAVDRVVAHLMASKVENLFVEIGGEVRVIGSKDGHPWKVGIQIPDGAPGQSNIAHAFPTDDSSVSSMATSGDYRNFILVAGKRYSHTIDPRTQHPVEHDLASVSVVASTCMEADAWATAINVLGPKQGAQRLEREGIAGLLISRTPDGFIRMGTGILDRYSDRSAASDSAAAESESEAKGSDGNPTWTVFAMTFVAFTVLVSAMAIGVIFARKPISGSCGGIAGKTNADGSTSCSLCGTPSDACKQLRENMQEKKT